MLASYILKKKFLKLKISCCFDSSVCFQFICHNIILKLAENLLCQKFSNISNLLTIFFKSKSIEIEIKKIFQCYCWKNNHSSETYQITCLHTWFHIVYALHWNLILMFDLFQLKLNYSCASSWSKWIVITDLSLKYVSGTLCWKFPHQVDQNTLRLTQLWEFTRLGVVDFHRLIFWIFLFNLT